MNSRDHFPDEELRRRIMDFIMAAGQTLLENGAEVFRVEQTMEIMARSFHLREFHVYVLTNGIFASAGTAEISEVRNVPVRTTHLGRVAAVNELSRQIAQTGMTLDEAESRLVLARQLPFPKDHVQLLSGLCGAFCFAMMFGGNLRSALAAAGAGLVASWYLLWCGRHEVPGGFQKISTAALITLVCILLCNLLHTSASHAIIGTLMILTPGIAFTMGIRDFVQGDYLSGTIRMIDALLIAASIAIGTGLVLRLYTVLTGGGRGMMSLTAAQIGELTAQFFSGRGRHAEFCHSVCMPQALSALLRAGRRCGLAVVRVADPAGRRRRHGLPAGGHSAYHPYPRVCHYSKNAGHGVFADRHFPACAGRRHLLHRLLFHPERKHPCPCQGHQHL